MPTVEVPRIHSWLVNTGQGQQNPEMFLAWQGYSPPTDAIVEYFHGVTGTEPWKKLDKTALKQAELMQPANVAFQVMVTTALQEAGVEFDEVSGHSLGEVSATFGCGGFESATDAIDYAKCRAEASSRAIARLPEKGGMVANLVRGSEDIRETVRKVAKTIKSNTDITIPSNINARGEVITSGLTKHLEAISYRLGMFGIKSIKLDVDGPFHTPMMHEAEEELEELLKGFNLLDPRTDIILSSPTSLSRLTTASHISHVLSSQLTRPVYWVGLVEKRFKEIPLESNPDAIAIVEITPKNPVLSRNIRKEFGDSVDSNNSSLPIIYKSITSPENLG